MRYFSQISYYALIILFCGTEDSGTTKAVGESPNLNVKAKKVSMLKLGTSIFCRLFFSAVFIIGSY